MEWKDLDKHNPRHWLEDGQEVDLFIQKHDITGKHRHRITDCYYDAKLDLFLIEDHRIVQRTYPGYQITHFIQIEEPV